MIALQPKLLRVLQEQEIVRLGESTPRKIDVRIVAATNQNFEAVSKLKNLPSRSAKHTNHTKKENNTLILLYFFREFSVFRGATGQKIVLKQFLRKSANVRSTNLKEAKFLSDGEHSTIRSPVGE